MDIGAACTIFQPAQYYCQDVNEKIKCTAFDSFEHRKIELTVTVACKRLMARRHFWQFFHKQVDSLADPL